tara:strand:- start:2264 stop:3361 length:1098 start_codon:yes stop_codon:yes gene_type:complete
MKCKWLENHTSIDSTGRVRPCCTWRNTGGEPLVTENLDDYRGSHFVKNVKQQLEKNIWPKGCEDCRLDEEYGNPSMRTKSFSDYKILYENSKDYMINPGRDAEIKFGNLCNLKCAMCSPYNSTLIAKEYDEMLSNGINHELIKRRTPNVNAWYEDEKVLSSVAKQMNDMTLIRFSGGEPTVNSYLANFLKQIDNKRVHIQITTNGNNWPQKLHEEVAKFKRVKLTISLDGYGKVNEYIRYPSNWTKITNNLLKMKSLPCVKKITLNTTVASYNVHQVGKLCEWAESSAIFHHQAFHSVYAPSIFHPSHASKKMKKQFEKDCEKYEQLKSISPQVQSDGDGLAKTVEYFKLLDKHRGTDISVLELD